MISPVQGMAQKKLYRFGSKNMLRWRETGMVINLMRTGAGRN